LGNSRTGNDAANDERRPQMSQEGLPGDYTAADRFGSNIHSCL
jgi:hypothetical protein